MYPKETVIGQTIFRSDNDKCEINANLKKYHLLHNVCHLQHRVSNLSMEKRKRSFPHFKVKQQNVFGLALIDTGNLVHFAIVSGEF